jgi:hypothetical protein
MHSTASPPTTRTFPHRSDLDMKRTLFTLAAALLFAMPVGAQTLFRASLDGFQETPPVPGTLAGGWAIVTLDTSTSRITYEVRTFGLVATAAHIHVGPPGVPGGIEVPLSGGPTTWAGISVPLTPGQIATMQSGGWYVNVHTAAFPGGEIRGQLLARPHQFGARLDGLQETPANASAAKGNATITLNPDSSVTYSVTTTGLVGAVGAHLHSGAFGVPGGIEVPLVGGPTTWAGTSLPLTPGQIEILQTKGWYVNLHTGAFPGGEIRGQIVPAGIPYGPSSDPPTGTITLNATGAPTDVGGGGTVSVSITGGKPGGLGYMFSSFAADALLFKSEPFVVDLGLVFHTTILPLDGAGSLSASFITPPLPADFFMYMQFFGLDAAAPNGKFNASNGLVLPFSKF